MFYHLTSANASRKPLVFALACVTVLLLSLLLAPAAQALNVFEQEALDMINAERESLGYAPMAEDPMLSYAARIRAQEATEVFSHKRPDKTQWKTIFDDLQIAATERSENLAKEHDTPKSVVYDGWMKSKMHRENMLNPVYTHVGLSYVEDANGHLYWCMLMTVPADDNTAVASAK